MTKAFFTSLFSAFLLFGTIAANTRPSLADSGTEVCAPSVTHTFAEAVSDLPAGRELVVLTDSDATAILASVDSAALEQALSEAGDGDPEPIPFFRLKAMGIYLGAFRAGSFGTQFGLRLNELELGFEGNVFSDWGLRAPGVEHEENETVSVLSKRMGIKYGAFVQARIALDGPEEKKNGILIKFRVLRSDYSLKTFAKNFETGETAPVGSYPVRGCSLGVAVGRYWANGFAFEMGTDFKWNSNYNDGVGSRTNGKFPNFSLIIPVGRISK